MMDQIQNISKPQQTRRKILRHTNPSVLLLTLLIATQCLSAIIAINPDYGDPDDFLPSSNGGESNSDTASNSEPIYDPVLLQQEVEAIEQKYNMDHLEIQTEIPLNDILNRRTEHALPEEEGEGSAAHMIEQNSKTSTTMIPEYVRKGKAEPFSPPPPTPTPANATVTVADNKERKGEEEDSSDYVEDEIVKTNTKQQQPEPPIAMKLYQNAGEEETPDHNDNRFIEPKPFTLPQQQDLPEMQRRQDFKPILMPRISTEEEDDVGGAGVGGEEDEEYYDETHQREHHSHHHHNYHEHMPHDKNKSNNNNNDNDNTRSSTTTAPQNIYPPNIAVMRSGNIPNTAIPLPQQESGSWTNAPVVTSTSSTTTTTTPTTTSVTTDAPPPAAASPQVVVNDAAPAQTVATFTTTPPTITGLSESTTDIPPTLPISDDTTPPRVDSTTATPSTMPQTQFISTAKPATTPTKMPMTTTTTTMTPIFAVAVAASAPVRPVGKQGKQINISRKLLPHEQLRNYIEDAYIRMPLAVIIDPSAESLEKTKALWRDALRTNLNIKIVLVSLNASGVPQAYNFNNTRQFLAGLNSIKEHNGGNAFIGILHASELVPYDSAVFISTAAIPPHTELVQDAAITLLKKRIRLYVIWFGDRSINENETQDAVGGILGEVAIRSGGEILHIVGSENSQELEGSTLTLVSNAFIGSHEVDIPVDTTLSSLHVKIDAPMRVATLETPHGDINLRKLVKFKSRILTLGPDDKRLDAYVPLTKLRKASVFKLKMVPESLDQEYSVFVRAERKADLFLDDMIKRFDTYFMEGVSLYPTHFRNARLQQITSGIATATLKTHSKLRFPADNDDDGEKYGSDSTEPKNEVETFSDNEIQKPIIGTQHSKANVTSAFGNAHQRSTDALLRGETRIELGVHSQVLVAPGMLAQLYFEITNTRSEPVYHNLLVVDEKRFLIRLTPERVYLRPNEMSAVTVTVLIPNGTPQGSIDKITFTCQGSSPTSLSLNLKVLTNSDQEDTTPPRLSWTFGSRCDYVSSESSNCAERFWTLDITAQDWETGIMRLQTTPPGLIYRNSYTVGSTEPLRATYVASCCAPKVTLVAYDIAGNQRSRAIDVHDIVITDAAIAAIVLGSFLLLLLIAALIAAIVWCCRRRKVIINMPTYRSHSTRSMD